MALVLGIVPGGEFFIGDTRVTVEEVYHPMQFKIKVHGIGMDMIYEVTDKHAVEALPGVRVSAGNTGSMNMVKVVLEAPRHIKILRGNLYREQEGKGDAG